MQTLFGIVIFVDPDGSEALIWCEDHGDLALYAPQKDDGEALKVNDSANFAVTRRGRMRVVVRVVKRLGQVDAHALVDRLRSLATLDASAGKRGDAGPGHLDEPDGSH